MCECTDAAQQNLENRRRLHRFLKAHDPEKLKDDTYLDQLLEKYQRKLHLMYLRLLKQYPSASRLLEEDHHTLEEVTSLIKEEPSAIEGFQQVEENGQWKNEL